MTEWEDLKGPVTPYYVLQNTSILDRPVRDAFPAFGRAMPRIDPFASRRSATRRSPGIRLVRPPVISDNSAAIRRIEDA